MLDLRCIPSEIKRAVSQLTHSYNRYTNRIHVLYVVVVVVEVFMFKTLVKVMQNLQRATFVEIFFSPKGRVAKNLTFPKK